MMRTATVRLGVHLAAALALAACTEGAAPDRPDTPTASLRQAVQSQGAEFRHQIARSSFDVGAKPVVTQEGPWDKVVGASGVFATFRNTGMAYTSPNADVLGLLEEEGPFGATGEEHNARAREYFLAAGIPAEQLGSAGISSRVRTIIDKSKPGKPDERLIGYTTILGRAVAGVRVAESKAIVQFSRSGRVVWESVYWPELPQALLDTAAGFRKKLQDSATRAAYVASLPPEGASAGARREVVIHHSDGYSLDPFWALPSCDITAAREGAPVRHFDETGREFRLASESPLPPDPPPPAPPGDAGP